MLHRQIARLYTPPTEQSDLYDSRSFWAWIGYYPVRSTVAPHFHRGIELVAPVDVHGDAIVSGMRYALSNDEVLCIGDGMVHAFRIDGHAGSAVMVLQADVRSIIEAVRTLEPRGARDVFADFAVVHRETNGELRRLLRRLVSEEREALEVRRVPDHSAGTFGRAATLFRLLTLLGLGHAPPGETARRDARIRQALEFVEDRIGERIQLDEIAQACAVSRFHLCKLFKARTGMTLTDYITKRRIYHAQRLLMEAGANVSEAAAASGFASVSYFIRAFRSLTGQTPKQWALKAQTRGLTAQGVGRG